MAHRWQYPPSLPQSDWLAYSANPLQCSGWCKMCLLSLTAKEKGTVLGAFVKSAFKNYSVELATTARSIGTLNYFQKQHRHCVLISLVFRVGLYLHQRLFLPLVLTATNSARISLTTSFTRLFITRRYILGLWIQVEYC